MGMSRSPENDDRKGAARKTGAETSAKGADSGQSVLEKSLGRFSCSRRKVKNSL